MRNILKKLPLILVFSLLIAVSLTVVVGAESGDVFTISGNLIIVCIVAAIITTVIFVVSVVASYKKKLRGSIYPFDKFTTLDLNAHSDTYSHSHTTRYKYKDSSNKK